MFQSFFWCGPLPCARAQAKEAVRASNSRAEALSLELRRRDEQAQALTAQVSQGGGKQLRADAPHSCCGRGCNCVTKALWLSMSSNPLTAAGCTQRRGCRKHVRKR